MTFSFREKICYIVYIHAQKDEVLLRLFRESKHAVEHMRTERVCYPYEATIIVHAQQRRSIGLVWQFFDNVQPENIYQLNCEIAADIEGYANTMF